MLVENALEPRLLRVRRASGSEQLLALCLSLRTSAVSSLRSVLRFALGDLCSGELLAQLLGLRYGLPARFGVSSQMSVLTLEFVGLEG